jgi:hypothetical protein
MCVCGAKIPACNDYFGFQSTLRSPEFIYGQKFLPHEHITVGSKRISACSFFFLLLMMTSPK